MISLTEEDFSSTVAEGNWIVDFYAPWCGPCKTIAKSLENLESKYPDVKFGKCDVDSCTKIAEEFHIRSVPIVSVFKNGKQVSTLVGAVPASAIERMLKSI